MFKFIKITLFIIIAIIFTSSNAYSSKQSFDENIYLSDLFKRLETDLKNCSRGKVELKSKYIDFKKKENCNIELEGNVKIKYENNIPESFICNAIQEIEYLLNRPLQKKYNETIEELSQIIFYLSIIPNNSKARKLAKAITLDLMLYADRYKESDKKDNYYNQMLGKKETKKGFYYFYDFAESVIWEMVTQEAPKLIEEIKPKLKIVFEKIKEFKLAKAKDVKQGRRILAEILKISNFLARLQFNPFSLFNRQTNQINKEKIEKFVSSKKLKKIKKQIEDPEFQKLKIYDDVVLNLTNFLLYIKDIGLIKFSLHKYIEKFLFDSALLLNGLWKPITTAMYNHTAFMYKENPELKKEAQIPEIHPFRGKAIEIDYIYKSKPEYSIHQFDTIIAPLLTEQLIFTIATLGTTQIVNIFPKIKNIKLFQKEVIEIPKGMEKYYVTKITEIPQDFSKIKNITSSRQGYVYRSVNLKKPQYLQELFKDGIKTKNVQSKNFCGSLSEASFIPHEVSAPHESLCFAETVEGAMPYLTGQGHAFSQKITQSKEGFRVLIETEKLGFMQKNSAVITSTKDIPSFHIKNVYIFNKETQGLEIIKETSKGFKIGNQTIILN
jgi:hypothetical protein